MSRYRIRRRWWMGVYRYSRCRWHLLFAFVDLIGWLLFAPARVFSFAVRCVGGGAEHSSPRRILLIQLDHLGDAVLSSGMFAALRREFPLARVDVLCSAWNRELFEALPDVADVHVLATSRFARGGGWSWMLEIVRCGLRLRRKRYDLAIDVRGEFPHAVLMWLAGAKRRLGWRAGGGGFLLSDSPRWVHGRHELASRLALLQTLGIACDMRDIAPRLAEVSGSIIQRSRPTIVLHVAAGTPAKRWPAEHWRELVARLVVEFDAAIRLVGGTDGDELATELTRDCELRDVRSFVGRTGIAELITILREADLFIGPDSGPAHLAAAVDTPAVVLFSGTNDPAQWRPWGERVTVLRSAPACSPCHREVCPLKDHPCMAGLTPEQVMAAARGQLLSKFPAFGVSDIEAVAEPRPSGSGIHADRPHPTTLHTAEPLPA